MEEKRRQFVVGFAILDSKDPAPMCVAGTYYNGLKTEHLIGLEAIFEQPDVKQSLQQFLDCFNKHASDLGVMAAQISGVPEPIIKQVEQYKADARRKR